MQVHRPTFSWRQMAGAISLLACACGAPAAMAQQDGFDAAFESRTSIDDNYLFSTLPHKTVLILALTPSLSFYRKTEASDLHLDAMATSFVVDGQSDENHTNPHLSLTYYLRGETDTFSTSAIFLRDLTVEGELANTGLLLALQRRDDLLVTPAWTHFFSERLQGQILLSAEAAKYTGAGAAIGLSNYHNYALPISASYATSERDTLTIAATTSFYSADQIVSQTQSEELQLSWQHKFDERGVISIDGGEFRAQSRTQGRSLLCPVSGDLCSLGFLPFIVVDNHFQETQNGGLLDSTLQYQLDESNSLTSSISRDLSPSGAGSLLLVESVAGSLQHDFDSTMTGHLALSRTRSQSLGGSNQYSNGYQSVSSSVSWKLDPFSTLEVGLSRSSTTTRQFGPAVHADEVYASYRYNWSTSTPAQYP